MAKLCYSSIVSLDGFIEDAHGGFDWGAPDEEVHRFVNELERPVGTYLYGRRMYETMRYWETAPVEEGTAPFLRDFATLWQRADKVVFSRTLDSVSTARTRMERSFEPEAVRRLKETSGRDLTVGGADLAGQAMRAGLVDELQVFVVPVVVGGGKPSLVGGLHLELELLETRPFASGVVFLKYRSRGPRPSRNFGGWLTTVVPRICLEVLRSRRTRQETFEEHLLPSGHMAMVSKDTPSVP